MIVLISHLVLVTKLEFFSPFSTFSIAHFTVAVLDYDDDGQEEDDYYDDNAAGKGEKLAFVSFFFICSPPFASPYDQQRIHNEIYRMR